MINGPAFASVTSSAMNVSSDSVGELFRACDLDGSGFIDANELANICPDLGDEEISQIFQELDRDGDGKISVSEFSEGFQVIGGRRDSLTVARRGSKTLKDSNLERRGHRRVTPKNSFDQLGEEDVVEARDPNYNRLDIEKDTTDDPDKVKDALPDLGVCMDEGFASLSW